MHWLRVALSLGYVLKLVPAVHELLLVGNLRILDHEGIVGEIWIVCASSVLKRFDGSREIDL